MAEQDALIWLVVVSGITAFFAASVLRHRAFIMERSPKSIYVVYISLAVLIALLLVFGTAFAMLGLGIGLIAVSVVTSSAVCATCGHLLSGLVLRARSLAHQRKFRGG